LPVSAGPGRHEIDQCPIPAGVFWMGDTHGDGRIQDGETPIREVASTAAIDATTVTTSDFAGFVTDTDITPTR
jgi:sulfatase modifying factor 1